jgi:hypothetical protein
MAKRGLLLRSFWLVIPLVLLLLYGCNQTDTTTSPSPSQSPSPSDTTTPSVTFPPGTDLAFETIVESGKVGGPYEGKSAQIRVVNDTQTTLPEWFDWVDPHNQTTILGVDYSKYLVVIVFNGYRSGIWRDLSIQRIWQNDNEVFVLAHFNDFVSGATSLPAFNSQYQVVKIDKTLITHPGEITFILLDELGEERARTIREISQ